MKKYSDDEILRQLKKFYNKNKKITEKTFSNDKKSCSVTTVIDRFGSWNVALEKSGIKERKKELTTEEKKEKVKDQVREFKARTGKLPVNCEYMSRNGLPSLTYVNRLFGDKNYLYAELGYTAKKFGESLNKEQIIIKMQNFYKREGREPLQKEFIIENDLPTMRDIKTYFKGIAEAKIAAGFKIAIRHKVYTRKEVIEALQTFYEREGRYPLKEDIKAKNELPPITKLRSLFGTLREAREAAGMEAFGTKKTFIVKEDLEEWRWHLP